MNLALTHHANTRVRQRGLREADVSLIHRAATPVADDAWLMTNADADREIARCRREIEMWQRLRGWKVVIVGAVVVTAYHSGRPERQRGKRRWR